MGLRDNTYWVKVTASVLVMICMVAAQGGVRLDQCAAGCEQGIIRCSSKCAARSYSSLTMQEAASCLGNCGAQNIGCLGECFATSITSLATTIPTSRTSFAMPSPPSDPPAPPPPPSPEESYHFKGLTG